MNNGNVDIEPKRSGGGGSMGYSITDDVLGTEHMYTYTPSTLNVNTWKTNNKMTERAIWFDSSVSVSVYVCAC